MGPSRAEDHLHLALQRRQSYYHFCEALSVPSCLRSGCSWLQNLDCIGPASSKTRFIHTSKGRSILNFITHDDFRVPNTAFISYFFSGLILRPCRDKGGVVVNARIHAAFQNVGSTSILNVELSLSSSRYMEGMNARENNYQTYLHAKSIECSL